MRRIATAVIATAWLLPMTLRAEVIRFDIVERAPAFAGRSFGDVGPYERITARATRSSQISTLLPAMPQERSKRWPMWSS
jgi:hypothetical protein